MSADRKPLLQARIKLITGIVIAVLVLVVIFSNNDVTDLKFLKWTVISAPLSLMLLVSFAAGAVAGVLGMRRWLRGK